MIDQPEHADVNTLQHFLSLLRGVKEICSPLIEVCAGIKRLLDASREDELPLESFSSYIDRTYEEAVTCRAECARILPILTNDLRSITAAPTTSNNGTGSAFSVQALLGMGSTHHCRTKQYSDCDSTFIVFESLPIKDDAHALAFMESEETVRGLQVEIDRLQLQISEMESTHQTHVTDIEQLRSSNQELKLVNEVLKKTNEDLQASAGRGDGTLNQLNELQREYDDTKETLMETQKECARLKRELEMWDSKEKELTRLRLIMRFSQLKRDSDQLHVFKSKITEMGIPCDILDPIDIFNDQKPKSVNEGLSFMRPVDRDSERDAREASLEGSIKAHFAQQQPQQTPQKQQLTVLFERLTPTFGDKVREHRTQQFKDFPADFDLLPSHTEVRKSNSSANQIAGSGNITNNARPHTGNQKPRGGFEFDVFENGKENGHKQKSTPADDPPFSLLNDYRKLERPRTSPEPSRSASLPLPLSSNLNGLLQRGVPPHPLIGSSNNGHHSSEAHPNGLCGGNSSSSGSLSSNGSGGGPLAGGSTSRRLRKRCSTVPLSSLFGNGPVPPQSSTDLSLSSSATSTVSNKASRLHPSQLNNVNHIAALQHTQHSSTSSMDTLSSDQSSSSHSPRQTTRRVQSAGAATLVTRRSASLSSGIQAFSGHQFTAQPQPHHLHGNENGIPPRPSSSRPRKESVSKESKGFIFVAGRMISV